MRYIIFLSIILVNSLGLSGCGNNSAEEKKEPTITPVITSTDTIPQNNTSTTNSPTAPIINTPQQTTNNGATTAGINPAHGQPGHRCDTGVGESNSKPTQPAVTVQQPISTPTINPVNAVQGINTSTSSAGLNPEHGKSGHRCEISVGAPLNSKPIQSPTTTQQLPPSTQNPYTAVQKPTPPSISAPNGVIAAGMNPEHGKPGHRCDISVGAPLNSKPKQ